MLSFVTDSWYYYDRIRGGVFVKKLFLMLVILVLVFSSTALACECDCYYCRMCIGESEKKPWEETTFVVAAPGWNYDVKSNVRRYPYIDSDVVGVVTGGTELDIIDFFFDETDGRIWAQIWYKEDFAYVSMKYLQPLDTGSYVYLSTGLEVIKEPREDSRPVALCDGEQSLILYEIVENEMGYWGKTMVNGRYGYIQMVLLDAMW